MAISDGVTATAANFNAAFASKSTANTISGVQTLEKEVILKEVASPSTPSSGYVKLYAKTDDELYFINDSGIESQISNQSTTPSAPSIVSKSTTYTALTTDDIILCTAASDWTLTLFASASNSGKKLIIKKTDSNTNAITIDANSTETIDGALTFVLSVQYQEVEIVCDGSNWHIINSRIPTIAAKYRLAGAVAASTTQPINFATSDFDTHSCVTTGSSWKFTAPMASKYSVSVTMSSGSSAADMILYKNGSTYNTIMSSVVASVGYFGSSQIIDLAKGDYLDIRFGASLNTEVSTGLGISIHRLAG